MIDDDLSTGDYVPIYLGYRKLTMDRLVELTLDKLISVPRLWLIQPKWTRPHSPAASACTQYDITINTIFLINYLDLTSIDASTTPVIILIFV